MFKFSSRSARIFQLHRSHNHFRGMEISGIVDGLRCQVSPMDQSNIRYRILPPFSIYRALEESRVPKPLILRCWYCAWTCARGQLCDGRYPGNSTMSIFVAPTTDTRSGHPFVIMYRLSVSGYTGPVFDSTVEMEEGRYGPTVRTQ